MKRLFLAAMLAATLPSTAYALNGKYSYNVKATLGLTCGGPKKLKGNFTVRKALVWGRTEFYITHQGQRHYLLPKPFDPSLYLSIYDREVESNWVFKKRGKGYRVELTRLYNATLCRAQYKGTGSKLAKRR